MDTSSKDSPESSDFDRPAPGNDRIGGPVLAEENSLLVALSSYRPRPDRTPMEDFITEAFAWLLSSRAELGRAFLRDKVLNDRVLGDDVDGLSEGGADSTQTGRVEWSTQVSFSKSRPDMVAQAEGTTIAFEHKVYEVASEDQPERHRDGLQNDPQYGGGLLALITSATWHHQNTADVQLTWAEIYEWLGAQSGGTDRMAEEFRALLASQGLGPRPTLPESSLRAYRPSKTVEKQLRALFEDLWSRTGEWKSRVEALPHLSEWTESKMPSEGRLGIQFNGESPNAWTPGLFAGVHLDGEDHEVEMSNPDLGPDLAVVLDVSEQIGGTPRPEILGGPLYRELVDRLKDEAGTRDWDVVDTYGEPGSGNPWHPLLIRRPLSRVLQGTESFEEQASAVLGALKDGLDFLVEDGRVRKMSPEGQGRLEG